MDNRNTTRTAAIIFSEDSSAIKSTTIQRKIIESLFVENENKELSIDQIIDEAKKALEMDFEVDEIETLFKDEKKSNFEIHLDSNTGENYIKLENNRYEKLKEREKQNSIYSHIERFVEEIYNGPLTADGLNEVLYRYVYELLNKNIDAFRKIANSSNHTKDLYVDPNIFSYEERIAINDFIDWVDYEKNQALFALISYAIEFAVITNHYESSEIFLKSIKNKVFYLDNNVLYRAIGINGKNRQNRLLTFLDKCFEAGQSFKISSYTEKEFRETIKHHIKNLQEVPFKSVNYNLFSKYSLNPGIYEYYHQWKANRSSSYGFDLFTSHLLTKLDEFKKKYNVETVFKMPFDEMNKSTSKKIAEYQEEIARAKNNSNEQSHYFDAINTYLIEQLRGQNQNTITDTKYFFISTDQKLRNWDFSRNSNQPIALLPSQWMAILLKYHSRSSNDFSSYLSFLKLKTNTPVINEDDLQPVLAGISEITQDFEKQETILDNLVELKFSNVLDGNNKEEIYNNTIQYVTRNYEDEIAEVKEGKHQAEKDKSKNKINFKEQLLAEKNNSIKDLENQKKPIERVAYSRFKIFKIIFVSIISLYFIVLGIATYLIGWDTIEPFTYLFGAIGFIFSYIYMAIYGNNFNPGKFFENKEKEIKTRTFSEFNFNNERLNELKKEKEELNRELEELKTLHNIA